MDADRRAAMLDAIVVLEMVAFTVEGQRKLNQHKPDADHLAVVRALELRGAGAKTLAAVMRVLRPGLEYD